MSAPEAVATRSGRGSTLVIVAGAVIGGVAVWWMTPAGLAPTTDTSTYLSVARHLADGHGLTAAFANESSRVTVAQQIAHAGRIPLTEWPPGYPLLLALGAVFGLGGLATARVLAVLGGALLCATVVWMSRRALDGAAGLAVLVGVVAVVAPVAGARGGGVGGFLAFQYALSESVYVPVGVAVVAFGASVLVRPSRPRLVALVVAIGFATLVRFTGPALGIGLGWTALVVGDIGPDRSSRRRRVATAALVASSGFLTVIGWMVVDAWIWGASSSTRVLAWHPDTAIARHLVRVMAAWFAVPSTAPIWFAAPVVLGAVVLPVVVVLVPRWRTRLWAGAPGPMGEVLTHAAAAVVVTTLLVVVANRTVLDQVAGIDDRLLQPLQPLVYFLAAVVVHHWLQRSAERRAGSLRHVAAAGLVAGALVLAAPALVDLRASRSAAATETIARRRPTILSVLADAPPDVRFVTNFPSALWLATRRPVLLLPPPVFPNEGAANPDYEAGLRSIAALAEREQVIVVAGPPLLAPDGAFATTRRLEATAGFVRVASCGDGFGLWALRDTASARVATQLCPPG